LNTCIGKTQKISIQSVRFVPVQCSNSSGSAF